MRELKLGSLFDGSGGFPLAGAMNGIRPVWASEIEPYPLRVTAARFPGMTQLGDVTRIDGAAIEPVDIITFGSPCQDLSVAGRQAGIRGGTRSGLFFEAVRIIKEMRHATADELPRFAVWENVLGAFSSHGGEDFKTVLEALCNVRGGSNISIPLPPGRRWLPAGCVVGDGYSLAWRVYDAQYWGVPQRRKRIYLVADFGSERAGEILFKREGVRGDSEAGREARENGSGDAEGSAGGSGQAFCESGYGHWTPGYGCLRAARSNRPDNPGLLVVALKGNWIDRDTKQNGCGWSEDGSMYTLDATDRHAVCVPEAVFENHPQGGRYSGPVDVAPTVAAHYGTGGNNQPLILGQTRPGGRAVCVGNGQPNQLDLGEKAGALNCMHDQQAVIQEAKAPRKYIVRRLTPLECCRLQGFPDWWEDGAEGSDRARYKMWGNGVSLPTVYDVLGRIARAVARDSETKDSSAKKSESMEGNT